MWGGGRTSHPKICLCVMPIVFELTATLVIGSRGTSTPTLIPYPPNYLEEFELETLPMRLSEITFFDPSMGWENIYLLSVYSYHPAEVP